MFPTSKHTDEPPKDQLEACLRFQRWKFGNRRLIADDDFQFRDEVRTQQAVRTQRCDNAVAPLREISLAQAKKFTDETLERLRDSLTALYGGHGRLQTKPLEVGAETVLEVPLK